MKIAYMATCSTSNIVGQRDALAGAPQSATSSAVRRAKQLSCGVMGSIDLVLMLNQFCIPSICDIGMDCILSEAKDQCIACAAKMHRPFASPRMTRRFLSQTRGTPL